MIDFREIVVAQYEENILKQFDSFTRNGWGQILIDYINKKEEESLRDTGCTFLDPELRVINSIRVEGEYVVVRFTRGNTLRFAVRAELLSTYTDFKEIYIKGSELLNMDENK